MHSLNLGIVIILVGVEIYTRDQGWINIKSNRFLLIGFGFLSGMMCGLFGIGALLAAYVGRVAENNDEFKANLSAVFIVENIFRIITYTEIGLLNLEVLHRSIYLCPYMIIGLILGMGSCRLLDEKKVKVIVIIALIISSRAKKHGYGGDLKIKAAYIISLIFLILWLIGVALIIVSGGIIAGLLGSFARGLGSM